MYFLKYLWVGATKSPFFVGSTLLWELYSPRFSLVCCSCPQLRSIHCLAMARVMDLHEISVYSFRPIKMLKEQEERKPWHRCWHLSIYTKLLPLSSRHSSCSAPSIQEMDSNWFSLFVEQHDSQERLDSHRRSGMRADAAENGGMWLLLHHTCGPLCYQEAFHAFTRTIIPRVISKKNIVTPANDSGALYLRQLNCSPLWALCSLSFILQLIIKWDAADPLGSGVCWNNSTAAAVSRYEQGYRKRKLSL